MAATALERLPWAGPAVLKGALATGRCAAEGVRCPALDRTFGGKPKEDRWGPQSGAACHRTDGCARRQEPAGTWGQGRGGLLGRRGVRAQAAPKQGAKVALVGKKLQLKPPVPRPEQGKEAVEKREEKESTSQPQRGAQEEEARAALVQPPQVEEAERTAERGGEQQAQAESGPEDKGKAAAAEAPGKGQGVEPKPAAAQSPEEQAAELQALRKALQGVPGGEPARSSGAFYAGVLEEIGLINWPPLGQVGGTTALVMGMLVGAAAVLTVLNYGLSEGTKAFFEDGPVRDAVRGSLGL